MATQSTSGEMFTCHGLQIPSNENDTAIADFPSSYPHNETNSYTAPSFLENGGLPNDGRWNEYGSLPSTAAQLVPGQQLETPTTAGQFITPTNFLSQPIATNNDQDLSGFYFGESSITGLAAYSREPAQIEETSDVSMPYGLSSSAALGQTPFAGFPSSGYAKNDGTQSAFGAQPAGSYGNNSNITSSVPAQGPPHRPHRRTPTITLSEAESPFPQPETRTIYNTFNPMIGDGPGPTQETDLSIDSLGVPNQLTQTQSANDYLAPQPEAVNNQFLHPYVDTETDLENVGDLSTPPPLHISRDEEGAWERSSCSGQAGLAPAARSDAEVASPKERGRELLREDKNREIERWRRMSSVDDSQSRLGPVPGSLNIPKNHRRARSMGDVPPRNKAPNFPSQAAAPTQALDAPEPLRDPSEAFNGIAPLDTPNEDVSNEPLPHQWLSSQARSQARELPPSSANAMQWYESLAQETASLSLAATWGSRRLSDTDLGSVKGLNLARLVHKDQRQRDQKRKEQTKRENILKGIHDTASRLKRRASQTKRKLSISHRQPAADDSLQQQNSQESVAHTQSGSEDSAHASGEGGGHRIAPVVNRVKRLSGHIDIRRRSRSNSGLFSLMTDLGGPPVAILPDMFPRTSPDEDGEHGHSMPPSHKNGSNSSHKMPSMASVEPQNDTTTVEGSSYLSIPNLDTIDLWEDAGIEAAYRSAEEKENAADRVFFDDDLEHTVAGFKNHVLRLNPQLQQLAPYLADRLAQEQMRRYNLLLAMRCQHIGSVKDGKCSSRTFCLSQGVATQSTGGATKGQVLEPNATSPTETVHSPSLTADSLPSIVPRPPCSKFPAQFECSFCFRVKKFQKPSDWTKHMHEDIQPFTCTFPNCPEPKSFKRKADWVRHENERHRHLEWWVCDRPGCEHKCYRRDNFVQHLVREHRLPEPPNGRLAKSRSNANVEELGSNDIARLLATCHRCTEQKPEDEKCCFCGLGLSDWKDLSTHMAQHLLRIAMPVLHIVQKHSDSACSQAVQEQSEGHREEQSPMSPTYTPLSSVDFPTHSATSENTYDEIVGSMFSKSGQQQAENTSSLPIRESTQGGIKPVRYSSLPEAMQEQWPVPERTVATYPFPDLASQSTGFSHLHWGLNSQAQARDASTTLPPPQPPATFMDSPEELMAPCYGGEEVQIPADLAQRHTPLFETLNQSQPFEGGIH